MTSDAERARCDVLRTFAWVDGDALLTRVLLVDDWIETGSRASAIADAVAQMGATLVGTSVIVDQAPAAIRAALDVVGLVRSDQLPENRC